MLRSAASPATVLRRGLLAGASVAATVVLSACGGDAPAAMDHGTAAPPSTGTPPSIATSAPGAAPGAASANDADVMFARMMVPHHQQAVQMAALAPGRASDPAVLALARQIGAAQQPEIDTMTGWLAEWGAPAPAPAMSDGSVPGMGHDMPGMISHADLAALGKAKGAAFDKTFLTLMISHHEGAVSMAREEVAGGADASAKVLAQKIIVEQQAEITTMKGILAGQR